jgi:hypothetical protein
MDRLRLRAILAESRRRNGSALAASALALLNHLAVNNLDDVAVALNSAIGPEHRRTLMTVLRRDARAAPATPVQVKAVHDACAALVAWVEAAPPAPPSVAVNIFTDSGTVANSPVSVMNHADSVTFPPPADLAAARGEAALVTYLRRTLAECNALPLGQLDHTDAAHTRPLELSRVYIGLNTTAEIELTEEEIRASPEARRPQAQPDKGPVRLLTALETVDDSRGRVMLLGAPGSGKSTFVSHLALCLAGAALATRSSQRRAPKGGWLACLPRW